MIEKNLGGERIGSGNKMKVRMRNYERSTHNLSQGWKSSMQIGTLYPFMCIPALRGDKFDIDLAAGVRTTPAMGALFGSYKLQMDVYACPVRLYTGILHNNPVNIGMKMDKVLFPQMTIHHSGAPTDNIAPIKFKTDSLLNYLGLSGMGCGRGEIKRTFNAVPLLAYYDIFKNYYANKQEKNAYVITSNNGQIISYVDTIMYNGNNIGTYENDTAVAYVNYEDILTISNVVNFEGQGISENNFTLRIQGSDRDYWHGTFTEAKARGYILEIRTEEDTAEVSFAQVQDEFPEEAENVMFIIEYTNERSIVTNTDMLAFPLENIDEMRLNLLSWHTMGAAYSINSAHLQPYDSVVNSGNQNELTNMNGLMIKTYQSDIFNNWLNKEYIDGLNGVADITKVSTEGGLKIDALNFAEKMYNLLNRIAVSGNTYYDWQDVVYEETPKPHLESPMYLGGLSQEIVFEEIVSQTATTDAPLGTLGGRGISRHRKGGKINFKCDEACFIIGIVSITPRINYSQGNAFYMTEILSMDDFHKPGLDGIGFQDLIGERMAFFDTYIDNQNKLHRHSIGKQPAWLEYMTAIDTLHGDFANGDVSYMVLDRDYEFDARTRSIGDATTYIDPTKYNYVFANTAIDAQNFWVQIQSNIIARRKMSAKLMPNI